MKQKKALLISILFLLVLVVAQNYLAMQEKIHQEQKDFRACEEEGKRIAEQSQKDYEARFLAMLAEHQDPAYRRKAAGIDDMPVFCIGDSVMLGAKADLERVFPSGTVDAMENRSFYPVYPLIQEKLAEGTEFGPVIIGIGTNGPLDYDYCVSILKLCGERDVFWLTTTNNWQFDNTETIMALGNVSDHVTVIDWDRLSSRHEEYFYSDGIHLTPDGRKAYADLVCRAVEDSVLSRLEPEPSLLLLGDDSLLACLNGLEDLSDTFVIVQEELDPESIRASLADLEEKGILPDQTVLVCHDPQRETLEQLLTLLNSPKVRILLLKHGKEAEESTSQTGHETLIYHARKEELAHTLHLNEIGRQNFTAWLEETVTFPKEEKNSRRER